MRIDEEFKRLIPPLSSEEREQLEENIVADGCRDAIVLWGDIIIDGHNRYEICTRRGIAFDTVQIDFESRQEAIEWIIRNQFGRRNLPSYERARLALRLKPIIAEKAKEQQGARTDINFCQKSDKCEAIDTKKKLADIAGVSHDTIAKVEAVEREAPRPIIESAQRGDISVNMAYGFTKMPDEDKDEIIERVEQGEKPKDVIEEVKKRPHVAYNSGNNEWYTPREYIEAARAVMGSIDTDPASSDIANETVNASVFYTAETNELDKEWGGNIWLNPPYASELKEKFVDKLVAERGNYNQAIVLVNNATETRWFSKIIDIASAVCFPRGRVKFHMPDGTQGAPLQGQAVIYIGNNANAFLKEFNAFGWVCNV